MLTRSQAWWNSVIFSDEKSSLKIISPFETEIIFGFVNFDKDVNFESWTGWT
jgi:hypothetical protein